MQAKLKNRKNSQKYMSFVFVLAEFIQRFVTIRSIGTNPLSFNRYQRRCSDMEHTYKYFFINQSPANKVWHPKIHRAEFLY